MNDSRDTRIVARGSIHGHEAGGTAAVVTSESGPKLRLENYWIAQGAPDVRVYLTQSPSGEVDAQGSVELGRVTTFSGDSLEYRIPEHVPLAEVGAVVIYCKAFSVTFGVAKLENFG